MDGTVGYPLVGVREHAEGYGVELARHAETGGRLCVRARNEGGNNETLIDLRDLVDWLRFGPESGRTGSGFYLAAGDPGEGIAR